MTDPREIEALIHALEAQGAGLGAEAKRLRAELEAARRTPAALARAQREPGAPPKTGVRATAPRSWRFGFRRTLIVFNMPTAVAFWLCLLLCAVNGPYVGVAIVVGVAAAVQTLGGLITATLELLREERVPRPGPSFGRALVRTLAFPLIVWQTVVLLAAEVAASFRGGSEDSAWLLRVGIPIELVGIGVPLVIYAFAVYRREVRAFSERRAAA
jgi:hypothetical protein